MRPALARRTFVEGCLTLCSLLLCGAFAQAADKSSPCAPTKTVPFDKFMKGLLIGSVPLGVPVPKGYEPTRFGSESLGYSYWMLPKEASKAERSHKLPVQTGYMYGKLSLDVGYDAQRDLFLNVEDAGEALLSSGIRDVHLERARIGNHALLFMDAVLADGKRKVSSVYVALNVATHVAYLTYVPPKWDRASGDCYWEKFKTAVKAASAPAGAQ